MQRLHIGIIGTGPQVEWGLLPILVGPDSVAPPDTGAWWSRRPVAGGDIRYQPPASPVVVALCEPITGGTPRQAEALARGSRIPAVYTDWRRMLREVPLDLVFLSGGEEPAGRLTARPEPAEVIRALAVAPPAPGGKRWVWADGPPARNLAGLDALHRAVTGREVGLWLAHPLRLAAAHRAARRLVERDEVGSLCAVQGRWPLPLDEAHFPAVYSALDLLLSFLGGFQGAKVTATRHPDGATSLWLHLASGASASFLFAAADSWNAGLPRVELCGSQGRYLLCEGGRRLWHHVPREGSRLWEPPGLASHITSAGINGLAEDVKALLTASTSGVAWDNAARLDECGHIMALWETIRSALESGAMEVVQVRGPGQNSLLEPPGAPENLTLNF